MIKADWPASNGVVHWTGQLIFPIPRSNLKQVLENDGRFQKLVEAFEAANMTDMLETGIENCALIFSSIPL